MGRSCGLVLAVAIAGCMHSSTSGPAWPKASPTSEHDGGESIAPHESVQMAAAIEKSDDDVKPMATPIATPAIAPSVETGTGSVAMPSITAPVEETITSEDIVIEINDD